jgi:hypothetical protein
MYVTVHFFWFVQEPALCEHCKQYGFECTFFLPITETRFKKKKLEGEAAEKEKAAAPAHDDQQLAHPKQLDPHVERDVIENLVNAYFADVAPILPIVAEAEFLATPNPAPVLVYAMCLVAAARREVPQKVFDSIRFAVNSVIKGEDVLSTASIVNVQALLILCMTGDCHSQYVPNALSALWIRLGSAIRMVRV